MPLRSVLPYIKGIIILNVSCKITNFTPIYEKLSCKSCQQIIFNNFLSCYLVFSFFLRIMLRNSFPYIEQKILRFAQCGISYLQQLCVFCSL